MSKGRARRNTDRQLRLTAEQKKEVIRWLEVKRQDFEHAFVNAQHGWKLFPGEWTLNQVTYNRNAIGCCKWLIAQVTQIGSGENTRPKGTNDAAV